MKFKKYNHSRYYGSRITWRSLTIAFTIVAILFVSNYSNKDEVYVAEKEPNVFMSPVVVVPEPTLEDKIKSYFPKNWRVMIAVAHAESQMSMDAQGWNCFYNSDETIVYKTRVQGAHSGACKVKDRALAYSTDCFVLQRNYSGKKCPEGVTIDQHLKEVAELSKVQGLNAWSAYKNKSYLAYYNK